jgi:hypothetical protein
MNVAILTRPDFRSPRVLAESLKLQLKQEGVEAEIFDEINLLNRMVSFKDSQLSFHFWIKKKIKDYYKDKRIIKRLKQFDAVIISECAPNGFFKSLYNVEKFKKLIKKPVGFYEVYYLGNAPTQIDFLKSDNDALLERYDFHLSVADVTEIKTGATNQYFPIGIKAKSWNLKPLPKKEIIAIIDFVHSGNEQIRESQINSLKRAGIKYISLEKPYTFKEIRNIYQQGAIYFMQSSEAFGIPILECFCCGCQIFTQESWWPMSWRLNENPEIHGEGILPECFTVYNNEEHLVKELNDFKENYDLAVTPKKVFDNFLGNYPDYYYGNETEIRRLLNNLQKEIHE